MRVDEAASWVRPGQGGTGFRKEAGIWQAACIGWLDMKRDHPLCHGPSLGWGKECVCVSAHAHYCVLSYTQRRSFFAELGNVGKSLKNPTLVLHVLRERTFYLFHFTCDIIFLCSISLLSSPTSITLPIVWFLFLSTRGWQTFSVNSKIVSILSCVDQEAKSVLLCRFVL